MTSNSRPVHPPRVAASLVDLCAPPDEADAILGDLHEEFSAMAARDGIASARRWYWRHSVRTIGHLLAGPLRTNPWSSIALGVGGLVVTWPLAILTGMSARAVVVRYPVYQYVSAPLFWTVTMVMPMFVVAFVLALVVRKRPMAAVFSFLLAMMVLTAIDVPLMLILFGEPPYRHITLAYYLSRWIRGLALFGTPAILGGALGRKFADVTRSVQLRPTAH